VVRYKLFKYHGHDRKNAADQIQRSVGGIRDRLTCKIGRKPGLDVDHLVYRVRDRQTEI
jgi:hypothetical protein